MKNKPQIAYRTDHTCGCLACIEVQRAAAEGKIPQLVKVDHTCDCIACILLANAINGDQSQKIPAATEHVCACAACGYNHQLWITENN